MKPTGRSLKAYQSGKRARAKNIPADKNPFSRNYAIGLASWWDKGWKDGQTKGGSE